MIALRSKFRLNETRVLHRVEKLGGRAFLRILSSEGRAVRLCSTRRRWSSNPSGKCSSERPTRGTVGGTMRSMCGADAGCLAINYHSLSRLCWAQSKPKEPKKDLKDRAGSLRSCTACDLKENRAFLPILSTERRGVRPCWVQSNPKGAKGQRSV